MEKLTKLQIIDETIEYYCNNPRSVDKVECDDPHRTACMYVGTEGKVCAFSRVVMPEYRDMLIEGVGASGQFKESDFDQHLFPQYRGHNSVFWNKVQCLHDVDSYWQELDNDKRELTPIGKSIVESLKKEYENSFIIS